MVIENLPQEVLDTVGGNTILYLHFNRNYWGKLKGTLGGPYYAVFSFKQ
jgi:hypothetical protein